MIIPDNVLYILVLIFPLIGIFVFLPELIGDIKEKRRHGIVSISIFLFFIVSLTALYINIILNNDCIRCYSNSNNINNAE